LATEESRLKLEGKYSLSKVGNGERRGSRLALGEENEPERHASSEVLNNFLLTARHETIHLDLLSSCSKKIPPLKLGVFFGVRPLLTSFLGK